MKTTLSSQIMQKQVAGPTWHKDHSFPELYEVDEKNPVCSPRLRQTVSSSLPPEPAVNDMLIDNMVKLDQQSQDLQLLDPWCMS